MNIKDNAFNICILIFVLVTILPPTIQGHVVSEALLPVFLLFLLSEKRVDFSLGDNQFTKIYFLLILSLYLCIIVNDVFRYSDLEKGQIYGTAYKYFSYYLILITSFTLSNNKTPRWVLLSLVAVGTIVSLIAILQINNVYGVAGFIDQYYSTATLTSNIKYVEEYRFRATSVLDSNPHLLGGLLLWPIIILILAIDRVKKTKYRIFFLSLLIINLVGLSLSLAKTAIIILICWFAIYIFIRNKKLFFLYVIILISSYLLLSFVNSYNLRLGYLVRGFQQLLESNPLDMDSLTERLYYWRTIINSMDSLEILVGGGKYLEGQIIAAMINKDSSYIHYLVNGGMFGLMLFLLLNLKIFANMWLLYRSKIIDNELKIFVDSSFYYFISALVLFAFSGIGSTYLKWSFLFWLHLGILFKIRFSVLKVANSDSLTINERQSYNRTKWLLKEEHA